MSNSDIAKLDLQNASPLSQRNIYVEQSFLKAVPTSLKQMQTLREAAQTQMKQVGTRRSDIPIIKTVVGKSQSRNLAHKTASNFFDDGIVHRKLLHKNMNHTNETCGDNIFFLNQNSQGPDHSIEESDHLHQQQQMSSQQQHLQEHLPRLNQPLNPSLLGCLDIKAPGSTRKNGISNYKNLAGIGGGGGASPSPSPFDRRYTMEPKSQSKASPLSKPSKSSKSALKNPSFFPGRTTTTSAFATTKIQFTQELTTQRLEEQIHQKNTLRNLISQNIGGLEDLNKLVLKYREDKKRHSKLATFVSKEKKAKSQMKRKLSLKYNMSFGSVERANAEGTTAHYHEHQQLTEEGSAESRKCLPNRIISKSDLKKAPPALNTIHEHEIRACLKQPLNIYLNKNPQNLKDSKKQLFIPDPVVLYRIQQKKNEMRRAQAQKSSDSHSQSPSLPFLAGRLQTKVLLKDIVAEDKDLQTRKRFSEVQDRLSTISQDQRSSQLQTIQVQSSSIADSQRRGLPEVIDPMNSSRFFNGEQATIELMNRQGGIDSMPSGESRDIAQQQLDELQNNLNIIQNANAFIQETDLSPSGYTPPIAQNSVVSPQCQSSSENPYNSCPPTDHNDQVKLSKLLKTFQQQRHSSGFRVLPAHLPKRKHKSPFTTRIEADKITERLYSGYDSPDLQKFDREHQQQIIAKKDSSKAFQFFLGHIKSSRKILNRDASIDEEGKASKKQASKEALFTQEEVDRIQSRLAQAYVSQPISQKQSPSFKTIQFNEDSSKRLLDGPLQSYGQLAGKEQQLSSKTKLGIDLSRVLPPMMITEQVSPNQSPRLLHQTSFGGGSGHKDQFEQLPPSLPQATLRGDAAVTSRSPKPQLLQTLHLASNRSPKFLTTTNYEGSSPQLQPKSTVSCKLQAHHLSKTLKDFRANTFRKDYNTTQTNATFRKVSATILTQASQTKLRVGSQNKL